MPKITKLGGPSHEGHVDVSSADTVTPDWAPAPEPEQVVEPPTAEPEAEVVEDKPSPRKRTRGRHPAADSKD